MIVVADLALGVLATAAVLLVVSVIRRPSLADRIVALDVLLLVIVAGIAVHAARTGDGTYLDIPVIAALLGFVGTITVARFIERRGARGA